MIFVWSLTLYETAKGFRVVIKGNGHTVTGNGPTPQAAHRAAECQLVVKPWVGAEPYEPVRQVETKAVLNCREAGPGRGLCDQCANGHYEKCLYVAEGATL